MKLQDAVRKLYGSERWLQRILIFFMVIYYGVLLWNGGLYTSVSTLDLTFNSMLNHLVHWQFDVDPNIIGNEGFLRNGHVYAYWGITCALFRLPLLLVGRLDVDVTRWSCLAAVCIIGTMNVRTLLFLRRHCGSSPASHWAFGLMLAYTVLGGAQIAYLRNSIYQEVVFWAIAFAAIFVYFAVKGMVSQQFSVATLSWMAGMAGLALLTRVSTGMGLYAAVGLLLLVLLVEEYRAGRKVLTRQLLIPAAILAAFLVAVGTVNYYRWGRPTTFADYSFYIFNQQYPDRMIRTKLYGLFNLIRIPFGLGYYFLPLWSLQGGGGGLLFENTQTRLMDAVELPPSSFFLTDLLPIAFIVFAGIALWSRRSMLSPVTRKGATPLTQNSLLPFQPLSLARGLAVAVGLFMPCILMLTAISMNYRYRMEFYPAIDFLSFLALYLTASNPALLARFNRYRGWMIGATAVSIVLAFVVLVLYKFSDLGPSQLHLRNGLVDYYQHTYGWQSVLKVFHHILRRL